MACNSWPRQNCTSSSSQNAPASPAALPAPPVLSSVAVSSSEPDGSQGELPPRPRSGLEARLADALVTRLVETRLAEALIDQVLRALMGSRTLEQLVIRLLERSEVSAAVDAQVDRQVERVLRAVENSQALRQLVREQADAYLKHLTQHPEPVRQLIQDQSRGMARDIQESVRGAALDADDVVETWVHGRLGRS